MFRNNPFGVVLLAVSAVVGVVLVWQIISGERLRYTGPDWIIWIIAGVMIVGSLYGFFSGRFRRNTAEWAEPDTGDRSSGDRQRTKTDDVA